MKKRIFSLLLCAAALVSLLGCTAQQEETTVATVTQAPTTEAATEAATVPPTEPTTVPATVPETTEPPLVLHSGLREDGTFDEGTLFIGDSLTYMFVGGYLEPRGLIGDCKYTAKCGSQVTAFFDDTIRMESCKEMICLYSEEFEGLQFDEAAAQLGGDATAIYLMWGTNYTPNGTAQDYIDIVDFLLENCPNATVHLQLVPYGDVAFITINKRIQDAYSHYQELGEPRVFLIDTFTAIGNHPIDGVHQGEPGNRKWYQAIVAHAQANNLSQ